MAETVSPNKLVQRLQARYRGYHVRKEPKKAVLNFAAAAATLHYTLSGHKKGYSQLPLTLRRKEKEQTAYYPEDTGREMTLWGKTKGGDLSKRWRMGSSDPYHRARKELFLNIHEDAYSQRRHVSQRGGGGEILRPLPQMRLPVEDKYIGYESTKSQKLLGQKRTVKRASGFDGMEIGDARPSYYVEQKMIRKKRPQSHYLSHQANTRCRSITSLSDKTTMTLTQEGCVRPNQFRMSRAEAKLRRQKRFFKRDLLPEVLYIYGSKKPEHQGIMGRYNLEKDEDQKSLCWTRATEIHDERVTNPKEQLLAQGTLVRFTPAASAESEEIVGMITLVDTRQKSYTISYGSGRHQTKGIFSAATVKPLPLHLYSLQQGLWQVSPIHPTADPSIADNDNPVLISASLDDPLNPLGKEPPKLPLDVTMWMIKKGKRWVPISSVAALEKKPSKTFKQKSKERRKQQEIEEVSQLMDYEDWDNAKNIAH